MKFGNIDGTPEEIREFTENHGLNVGNLFQVPETDGKLETRWVLIPALLVAVVTVVLPIASLDPTPHLIVFLLGVALLVWLSVSVNIRWGGWPTAIVAIGAVLILFVAAGFMNPKEAFDAAKELGS